MNGSFRVRWAPWAAIAAVLTIPSASAADTTQSTSGEVAHLVLRSRADVAGPNATVHELVFVKSGDAQFHESLSKARLPRIKGESGTFTHAQVLDALSGAGINVADVLLSGAIECQVRVLSAATDESPAPVRLAAASEKTRVTRPVIASRDKRGTHVPAAATATIATRRDHAPPGLTAAADTPPEEDRPSSAESTLADQLRARVQTEFESAGGTVELEFESAGREYLELASPTYTFDISGGRSSSSGLREFQISVQQDGVTQRSTRLFARVFVNWPVVVAKQPLAVGSYAKPTDLTLEQRRLPESAPHGFASTDGLIGQRLKNYVARGEMLDGGDLRQEPLVQRSRPVAVLSDAGGVSVRLNGVALDNGLLNDSVRVRVGPERGQRRELRGVVTGVGSVRLTEE